MTGEQVLAIVNGLIEVVREAPALVHAIEGVFTSVRTGVDETQAVKHLEAVASATALGLPTDSL